MDAKAEALSTSSRQIQSFLTPRHIGNQIYPAQDHPAVPLEDVIWLADRMENDGQTFQDAIKLLRQTKFPDNYDPYHWVTGKD
ncbi:hypothetical protein OS493_039542 [Desmophyllum pertusum]|uniref:Uncharacterized protein n=1 Tax=Desmophyllum pertusum TaxID=174260 RepID=A0A9W9ZWD4_9CNID|nr:hypothetical protein OS493_039542 [Desmophyllum pertusum]